MMTADRDSLSINQLVGDIRVLLLLFFSFRLVMLLAFQPVLLEDGESGIGVGGDRLYHFRLAALAEDDKLPFRDWWSEFPPIWHITTTAIYLILGDGVNYTNWSFLLGMMMLAAETGNLLLVRAIGKDVYDAATGTNLAWVYAVSVAPAIFMWWNFDGLMTFCFLLGIYLLLKRRGMLSALVIGIGILLKFVPALIFGAVIRFHRSGQSLRYIVAALATVALAYLPLLALDGELATVSLRAQFQKPSYQSIWALLDGNYATGNYGTVESRLLPYAVDTGANDNPSVIPNWLRLITALALGIIVFLRTRRRDQRGMLAFVGITVLIFYLQSQAWSPQWLCMIIPLTLLVFPTRRGVLLTVVLTLLAVAEYPLLWSRTGDLDPPGIMSADLLLPWVVLVLLRTAVLASLALAFYRLLHQDTQADQETS